MIYDPEPNFNCNDPTPSPIPRKPSWIARALTRLFSRKPQRGMKPQTAPLSDWEKRTFAKMWSGKK